VLAGSNEIWKNVSKSLILGSQIQVDGGIRHQLALVEPWQRNLHQS
jgi:hypothetical protein